MAHRETVAVVTMLCDHKANLIPLLVPRWNTIDYGDRDVVYVAVTNDACQLTCRRFEEAAAYPVQFVGIKEMAKHVPDLDFERCVRPEEQMANIIYLHRMAIMREAARTRALNLRCVGEDGKPRPVDWVYWLDQDVDPRAHSFLCLHQVLTATRGPQAPKVACGLYCTRLLGQDITGWLGDEQPRSYAPIIAGQVQASRVAGFGCVLMRRKTLAATRFDTYTDYRLARRRQREVNRKDTEGVLGEDIFWFRQHEVTTGQVPMIDNRVRCRHYHADGSYWRYDEEDGSPYLTPHYYTDEVLPGASEVVCNISNETLRLDAYRLAIPPGAEARVSMEIAGHLRELHSQKVEWAA